MPITPDAKNWTWTAERHCPECRFDASAVEITELPALVRANTREWMRVLAGAAADLRRRPNGQTWSPLEYAAHVRDVHRVYAERLGRFLTEQNPSFLNWDQDAAAVTEDYNSQEPTRVANELEVTASAAATGFEQVPADAWTRTASRSDGVKFTLDSFARSYLHDVVHHLWDVTARHA